ncbi:hypothetical protein psal_cds_127 [Pandoravirus salinus]|uniref:F-box domain containing protein n=1 Tax=Pandoravirus salinus TaxID=1349410 RepID=S4VT11_9VIRU|nr:hypothetical protein psal_cds_127 [Pandoravirus salinus]AGO83579.1 hypothetical protein psal_cds_127 [Pandoravirus salinus]
MTTINRDKEKGARDLSRRGCDGASGRVSVGLGRRPQRCEKSDGTTRKWRRRQRLQSPCKVGLCEKKKRQGGSVRRVDRAARGLWNHKTPQDTAFMAALACAPSLLDLPTEVLAIVVAWLGRPKDMVGLGATCSRMHVTCKDTAERHMRVARLAAWASIDAFVDEWQRIAVDCDDKGVALRLADRRRICAAKSCDAADGSNGDQNGAEDSHHDASSDDEGDYAYDVYDAGDSDDAQDSGDAGSDVDDDDAGPYLAGGFVGRRCVRGPVFNVDSPAFAHCTHTPDWSLHCKLPDGTTDFVCDTCARGVSITLDDPDHTRWPMSRIRLGAPHVWANRHCNSPTSYARTPPVVDGLRVPAGMDAWIDADAAAHLTRDICRARRLLDAEYGPSGVINYYDHEAYNDNSAYDADAVAKLGVVPRTVVQSDLGYNDSDDGESDDDNSTAIGRVKRQSAACAASWYATGHADDVDGDVDGKEEDDDINKDFDVDGHDQNKGFGDDDDDDDDCESNECEVVLDKNGKGAPCHDPFRHLTLSSRYAWWGSAGPAPLVRIYHAPVSTMGNLRAWLPIGMTVGRHRQPHRGQIARYVLVCCDASSPLWGAAMAVRSVTDRWPCISWLPAADNITAALAVYRQSVHKPTAGASLREGFVDWLCTARRTPAPWTWEARRNAASARGQPVLPRWTGFPHFG